MKTQSGGTIIARGVKGPCAYGMELEARRAERAVPTLFDQFDEETADDDAA